jgi:hypothetical protein
VTGVDERPERVVPAEERVDGVVVVRVVAMVRRRGEHRVEVERGGAESLDVVEPVDDPVEVATLEPVGRRRLVPRLERPRGFHPAAPGEAVGEDLVEDGVPDPLRRDDRHGGGPQRLSTRPERAGMVTETRPAPTSSGSPG